MIAFVVPFIGDLVSTKCPITDGINFPQKPQTTTYCRIVDLALSEYHTKLYFEWRKSKIENLEINDCSENQALML